MVITAASSTINFWDAAIGRPVGPLIGGALGAVTFSPNGQILAASTLHGAGLWNLSTRREIGRPIPSTEAAQDIVFSPDGKTFAIAGAGAQLWNVASRRPIGTSAPDGTT